MPTAGQPSIDRSIGASKAPHFPWLARWLAGPTTNVVPFDSIFRRCCWRSASQPTSIGCWPAIRCLTGGAELEAFEDCPGSKIDRFLKGWDTKHLAIDARGSRLGRNLFPDCVWVAGGLSCSSLASSSSERLSETDEWARGNL